MNGWTRWIVSIVFLAGTGWAVLQSSSNRIDALERGSFDREKRITRIEECIVAMKDGIKDIKDSQKEIQRLLREQIRRP